MKGDLFLALLMAAMAGYTFATNDYPWPFLFAAGALTSAARVVQCEPLA